MPIWNLQTVYNNFNLVSFDGIENKDEYTLMTDSNKDT